MYLLLNAINVIAMHQAGSNTTMYFQTFILDKFFLIQAHVFDFCFPCI